MKHLAKNIVAKSLALLTVLMLALLMPHRAAQAQDRPAFSQQQLEQVLAPIALYPDPLLSQILMASSYPLEVVEAARWSRNHANLLGEDAVRAAGNENWDPSVKSLLAFPQVLARMNEDLHWLQTLGDAFLGQEPQVMDTVQNLRRRAQAAGNLRSDEHQRIAESGPLLVVQPADPQIIYVPYYDPRVVYGPWWWPDYSPVYWRPFPGYYLRPGLASSFYWGPSIRISVGYFFGGFDWPHRHVRVVQPNYYYRVAANQRETTFDRDRPPGRWQHDPVHRRGVAYRQPEVWQRFAGAGTRPESRNQKHREEARRQDQQQAQPYPIPTRHGDVNRTTAQFGVQSTASSKVPVVTQQDAQPYPTPGRQSESRNEVRRIAVQPVTNTPVQPEIQRMAVTQPHSGAAARAERRDHVKDLDRRNRREPVETPQTTGPANVVAQTQTDRGNAPPSRSDQIERSLRPHGRRPHGSESNPESRPSPASRQEARQGTERAREVQSTPEASPGSARQRGAGAENALQQARQQR